MNPDQIKEVVETIKTLNLNIDSQTAVQVSREVVRYLLIVQVKEFILTLAGISGFVASVVIAIRAIYKTKKDE